MAIFDRVKKFIKVEEEAAPQVSEKKETKPGQTAARTVRQSSVHAWVLSAPHISEKSTHLAAMRHYVFRVAERANAFQIKKAVEERYGVHVERVAVTRIPRRMRRVRGKVGYRKGFKKAIVKVREGETITTTG